jgi:hypothetical protein
MTTKKTAVETISWVPAEHDGECLGSPFEKETGWCFDDAHYGAKKRTKQTGRRSNFVPAPQFFNLNQACALVNRALGDYGCFLVGSALERRDYRDIDVRFVMEDTAYDRLFHDGRGDQGGGWLNPLWSLMCSSTSLWLSQQSGLPIDFQIQRMTQANKEHSGGRQALGIFLDYPGERPSDIMKEQPK